MDARCAAPWVASRFRADPGVGNQGSELLLRPRPFASLHESGRQPVTELDQELDVQSGIDQPLFRQRPLRPVGSGVLLQQPHPEQLFDHGAKGNAGITEQSGGKLGVKQRRRNKPDLVQTRQILAGGMDDPLSSRDSRT
jgi:hypothetical protein